MQILLGEVRVNVPKCATINVRLMQEEMQILLGEVRGNVPKCVTVNVRLMQEEMQILLGEVRVNVPKCATTRGSHVPICATVNVLPPAVPMCPYVLLLMCYHPRSPCAHMCYRPRSPCAQMCARCPHVFPRSPCAQ
eukprot:1176095-Prorocentrum_minimum.AAC.1